MAVTDYFLRIVTKVVLNYICKQVTINVTSYFFRTARYLILYKNQVLIRILGNLNINCEQELYFALHLVQKVVKTFHLSILEKTSNVTSYFFQEFCNYKSNQLHFKRMLLNETKVHFWPSNCNCTWLQFLGELQ